jgi:hypothetical protein
MPAKCMLYNSLSYVSSGTDPVFFHGQTVEIVIKLEYNTSEITFVTH